MNKQLTFYEKTMNISLAQGAVAQSEKLNFPLIIEIQIYFSCLLGKRLAFYTEEIMEGCWQLEHELFASMLDDAQQLTDNIYIRFKTVMTKSCSVTDYVGPPPVSDFIITNQKPYVPGWLNIDCEKGIWSGEYGWSASIEGQKNTKQIRKPATLANRD